jgi:hypothetical protein
MPSLQTVRCSILVGLATVALVGCGEGLTGTSDLQQVSGDVGALGTPPDAAATIAFQTFDDDVGAQANTRTRTLIRSASGYQSLFGHAPPTAVDFSSEWVMFYAAGTEPTNGYGASFVAVLRSGTTLLAITQLTSPGAGCMLGPVVTAPYALIKFPAQPGTSAQFYKNDVTKDCTQDLCANAAAACPGGTVCDPSTGKCVPGCGPVCLILCDYGNVMDAYGCPTCGCNPPPTDPCATVDCGGGTHCDSGKCISDGVSCGGLLGKPCPGAGQCVDDPYDGCDPAAGAADCPGICQCPGSGSTCPAGSMFSNDPSVCGCSPMPPDPCATVKCATGTQCNSGKCVPVCGPVCNIFCQFGNVPDANGCPTCACNQPPPDLCVGVMCGTGTHCDSGKCVSDGVSCGGLAGKACPGFGQCADDPYDACDPTAGGADCPGICQCVQNVSCPTNSMFNGSPSVCACATIAPPVCDSQKCPAPAPGVPTKICPDGTTAGPVCTLNADGTCGWTVSSCAGS